MTSKQIPDREPALQSTIDRALQIAYDRNTSTAIRDLRQRLRDSNAP